MLDGRYWFSHDISLLVARPGEHSVCATILYQLHVLVVHQLPPAVPDMRNRSYT